MSASHTFIFLSTVCELSHQRKCIMQEDWWLEMCLMNPSWLTGPGRICLKKKVLRNYPAPYLYPEHHQEPGQWVGSTDCCQTVEERLPPAWLPSSGLSAYPVLCTSSFSFSFLFFFLCFFSSLLLSLSFFFFNLSHLNPTLNYPFLSKNCSNNSSKLTWKCETAMKNWPSSL